MPAGYNVYNVDVAAVGDGVRQFVMSIEVNLLAGTSTHSWAVIFAGTTAATPDAGWVLSDLGLILDCFSAAVPCAALRGQTAWMPRRARFSGLPPVFACDASWRWADCVAICDAVAVLLPQGAGGPAQQQRRPDQDDGVPRSAMV